MVSLREWAIKNEIWKPKSWRVFLENDLVPLYKIAWTLNELYNFLKSDKICGKSALADIEDEKLRNKIRVAIYGGVEQDLENSFAKFMFEHFGICAQNASSFEESIEHYRAWGDGVKISINPNSWINLIPIRELVNELNNLIWMLCREIGVRLSEIGIQDAYPYAPFDAIAVDNLLPEPGENPKELISLINDFRQKAVDLAIGRNPFTTFVYYVRTIPATALMGFLDCNINDIAKLSIFLGLRAYSMIDCSEVSLPTQSPEKVILMMSGYTLADKILSLQKYLERVEPVVKTIFDKMVKDAINQIQPSFDPWQDYEPIFSFWNRILKEGKEYCSLEVKNGKITKVFSYPWEIELPKKIWLRDFLIRLYPAVSTGIIKRCSLSIYSVSLDFSPVAREWVEKVIENEGKT